LNSGIDKIRLNQDLCPLTRKKTHIEAHRATFSTQGSRIQEKLFYQEIFIKPVVGWRDFWGEGGEKLAQRSKYEKEDNDDEAS